MQVRPGFYANGPTPGVGGRPPVSRRLYFVDGIRINIPRWYFKWWGVWLFCRL